MTVCAKILSVTLCVPHLLSDDTIYPKKEKGTVSRKCDSPLFICFGAVLVQQPLYLYIQYLPVPHFLFENLSEHIKTRYLHNGRSGV